MSSDKLTWSDAISQVFFPPLARCSLCSAPLYDDLQSKLDDGICDSCRTLMLAVTKPYCPRCALPEVNEVKNCPDCRHIGKSFAVNRSLWRYEGVARQALTQFKFNKRVHLAKIFAIEMAEKLICILPSVYDIITYVPMHPQAERLRGYNQSEVLARELSRVCGLPCYSLLAKAEMGAPSSQLSREERWQHERRKVFILKHKASGYLSVSPKVILVDDIFTTGATAHFCTLVLLEAGVGEVAVLTVAR